MIPLLLVLIPLIAGVGAFSVRDDRVRRALLLATAVVHGGLTMLAWRSGASPGSTDWLGLDSIGLIYLSILSGLFVAASVYGVGYLAAERRHQRHADVEEHLYFSNEPETLFTGFVLLFVASMTLVTVSQHLGLLWVAVEATTLSSSPLIYYHRHHRSLEAAWKYLLICSVGIALALLGNFLLAVAGSGVHDRPTTLFLPDLLAHASTLEKPWVKASFLFFLVGYGTKMGLAPMHTWLPDAHSESPSVVSALLSGALLNCAFLGILRSHQVCVAAGLDGFSGDLLILFGLLSMGFAAVFILGQADFKRMLAYSSVEHMGILAIGVGIGGAGAFGSALHAVNHSLTKATLFLVAGNILAAYHSKAVKDVHGIRQRLPVSGLLWVCGFLSITGSPPFGPFLSELTILKAAVDGGRGVVAAVYLALLALIFVGMANVVLSMLQGSAPATETPVSGSRREALWSIAPPVVLGVLVLVLGCYLPMPLNNVLHDAARTLGGR